MYSRVLIIDGVIELNSRKSSALIENFDIMKERKKDYFSLPLK